jgi:hypothetical protein
VWPSCDSNTQMWLFVYCRVSIQELIGLSVEDLERCNLWHFCARTERAGFDIDQDGVVEYFLEVYGSVGTDSDTQHV